MFYVEWVLMSDTRACSNLQSAVCNMASVTPTGATCARKYRRNTRERPHYKHAEKSETEGKISAEKIMMIPRKIIIIL